MCTCTCLAIGEDASVVALKGVVQDVYSEGFEHTLLTWQWEMQHHQSSIVMVDILLLNCPYILYAFSLQPLRCTLYKSYTVPFAMLKHPSLASLIGAIQLGALYM